MNSDIVRSKLIAVYEVRMVIVPKQSNNESVKKDHNVDT